MTFKQRLQVTLQLWPYMVPLFVVYFAEYAMQSGTWTAIGFPVTSADARHRFYLYSNWMYQAGEERGVWVCCCSLQWRALQGCRQLGCVSAAPAA